MLRFLKRWFDYWIPSDEDMELRLGDTLPKSLKELSDRRRELERRSLHVSGSERVNCTTSPLHRRKA